MGLSGALYVVTNIINLPVEIMVSLPIGVFAMVKSKVEDLSPCSFSS